MEPRSSRSRELEAIPEADRFEATPHPREQFELFGHAQAERDLLHIFRLGRLPHAILIGGPAGIGKATLAWRLARFLLANPYPTTESCRAASGLFVDPDHAVSRQIAALAHPDLFLLRRGWNEKAKKLYTEIRVDDIRHAARMFQQAPGQGGYRVCILDRAEDLNPSGANALLKLIEEPPPRSLFLIIAVNPSRLLPTIRSRCHKISLRPLSVTDIGRIIGSLGSPWSEAGEEDMRAASARAGGSIQTALHLLSDRGLELDARLCSLLQRLPHVDWREVYGLADGLVQAEDSSDYDLMLAAIFHWLDASVHRCAMSGESTNVGKLAGFARAWERLAGAVRETDEYNLDRRLLILSAFADLAAAAQSA